MNTYPFSSKRPVWALFYLAVFFGCDADISDAHQNTNEQTIDTTTGGSPNDSEPSPGAQWLLDGTLDERFSRVARHLRGFDMAMVETGYRYSELYWAGRDRNWGYANYQLRKLETAVANGLQRRPARARSAQMLDGAVSTVRRAIEAQDGTAMDAALEQLTATCNGCHRAEQVPFIQVVPPTIRQSPTGSIPESGSAQP